ncbi:MAG TPA: c-type cytochrome [Nitrospinota bacterium]|nr:c-type cytochrome [Nitrospinota bacterium]
MKKYIIILAVVAFITVSLTASFSKGDVKKGGAIYNRVCMACHAAGVAGAPKLGDKTTWAPRIKQGEKVLLEHTLKGFKVMPPKGGCGECSDQDIEDAIAYMLSKVQ